MHFGKSAFVRAVLHFFAIRVILYSPENVKRSSQRLTSFSEAIVEARCIKESGLFKDLAFKLI